LHRALNYCNLVEFNPSSSADLFGVDNPGLLWPPWIVKIKTKIIIIIFFFLIKKAPMLELHKTFNLLNLNHSPTANFLAKKSL
jgi:hypothetical protein